MAGSDRCGRASVGVVLRHAAQVAPLLGLLCGGCATGSEHRGREVEMEQVTFSFAKEEDKTFTKCATMYTDFIRACGNSMNPRQDRNGRQIASVHSGRGGGRGRGGGGRGDGRGRGGGGRGGGRSAGVPDQADVDKVNWLQANKYYTAKEYANFNPAEKAWIHQNRTEE